MSAYAAARLNMVESQIRPNKVTDPRLLQAFLDVPRELFVPKPLRGIAYIDEDIRIAEGRFLLEPMVLARLIESAAVQAEDSVLEIGCGTGYGTAILSRVANAVVAVEEDRELVRRASAVLAELAIENAAVVEARLSEGYPKQAPYDVIVFAGAIAAVPEEIAEQLAPGGRMVAVVREGGVGKATLMTRISGILSGRIAFDAASPYLPGFEPKPSFVF